MKRYELTKETKTLSSTVLHRIRATQDFYAVNVHPYEDNDWDNNGPVTLVKRGTLGGWIENEGNLDQDGLAWVANDAMVYGGARVSDAALVYGQAVVYGSRAEIQGFARVFDHATVRNSRVDDRARVHDQATVIEAFCCENADIYESAQVDGASADGRVLIRGDARIFGNAKVRNSGKGNLEVYDYAEICDDAVVDVYGKSSALIAGDAFVCEHAIVNGASVCDRAWVKGHSRLGDGVHVEGDAVVDISMDDPRASVALKITEPHAIITGDACIKAVHDCLVMGPIVWSEPCPEGGFRRFLSYLTFFPTEEGELQLRLTHRNDHVFRVEESETLRRDLERYNVANAQTRELISRMGVCAKAYFATLGTPEEARQSAAKRVDEAGVEAEAEADGDSESEVETKAKAGGRG